MLTGISDLTAVSFISSALGTQQEVTVWSTSAGAPGAAGNALWCSSQRAVTLTSVNGVYGVAGSLLLPVIAVKLFTKPSPVGPNL